MRPFGWYGPWSGSRSLVGVALALGALAAVGTSSFAGREVMTPSSTEADRVAFPAPAEEPSKALHVVTDKGVIGSSGDDGFVQSDDFSLSSLSFVPINPYRALDSRAYRDGDMFPGVEVYFTVWEDEGGVQRIPSDIQAVSYNLTVTNTMGVGGYLAVFPADIFWPGNSSINWFGSGLDLSNGGIVAVGDLSEPGQVSVYMGEVPNTATYFILDITGYFR